MGSYTGINIQYPISRLIVSGEKTVETRTYKLPEKFLNKELALIETPGSQGAFKARTIAIIKFTECIAYKNKYDFYLDIDRHRVTADSPWAWQDSKPKFGWVVKVIKIISPPQPCNEKGIVYRRNIEL